MSQQRTCAICGAACPPEGLYEFDGQELCARCLEEETLHCRHCHERIWQADNAGTEDLPLCQDCRDDYYTVCCRCGALIRDDHACYAESDEYEERPYCSDCYGHCARNEAIHDYYYKPAPIFYGDGPRFFGVELEIDGGGESREKALFTVLKACIGECKPIRFDGNGYCDRWKEEAARRGLDCETSVPLIFDRFMAPDTVKMFTGTGVLSEKELRARAEVYTETYTKKIQIEARVLGDLAMNHIIPVASRYQAMLLDKVDKINRMFPSGKSQMVASYDVGLIEKLSYHMTEIHAKTEALTDARKVANRIADEREKAIAYHDTVAPLFDEIR